MNFQEALQITKQQCSNCDHFVKCEYCARRFIIYALDKQIPKRPLPAAYTGNKCPACGEKWCLENYCANCGQYLLWDEE